MSRDDALTKDFPAMTVTFERTRHGRRYRSVKECADMTTTIARRHGGRRPVSWTASSGCRPRMLLLQTSRFGAKIRLRVIRGPGDGANALGGQPEVRDRLSDSGTSARRDVRSSGGRRDRSVAPLPAPAEPA
jgi:hypothetical protein